ncbi:hypothetical protein GQ55_8G211800 [Panicum hallii var. hallii]|uniref:DUF1618 domain-containing protein n=1 Tax=Panicum hallii var. hallii TaxID=1504633 RepID=A0A2T7CPN5_9POAL|nr:hypothetical protein GQ55_8G211800 [Panicum hallii var. hallii]
MAAPWVFLGRVARFAAADPGDDAEADPADFSLAVALPPRVAVLTAALSAQPDPARPDRYPYILAAGPGCLLSRFSAAPFYGVRFGLDPPDTHLMLVHRFGAAAGGSGTMASAVRVPDRPASMPAIRNIEGVGLVDLDDGKGYVIAELQIDSGSDRARLFRVHTGQDRWMETELRNPLPARDREWVPGGVVSLGGKLYWYDLSWGILIRDPFVHAPDLLFCSLPPGRVLDLARPHIHNSRSITVSRGALRYVEIIPEDGDNGEAARIFMSTMEPTGWEVPYEERFEEIWNDNSHKKTWLPKEVPELVVVCPSNPDLVYFALEQHIFSVNIRGHEVLEFAEQTHELVNLPWPTPASCRYVLAWDLPSTAAEAGLLLKEKRDHPDEETYQYAKFCSSRIETLKGKKDYELCHMCFFQNGCSICVKKTKMGDHCDNVHRNKGFLCHKTGCVVRAATLGDVGLHHHYLHGQSSRDWWRSYLEEHK